MVLFDIDIGLLSWILPLIIGTAVPFVVIMLNRSTQHKDSTIAEKVKIQEVAHTTAELQTTIREKFDKLDVELRLREDEYRKNSLDVKARLELITGKMQLVEYRLDKMNGDKTK